MKTGLRSYLIGMHNPVLHSLSITIAWVRLYRKLPSVKEAFCIFFHDIGYIKQSSIDGKDDRHPELGAKICGWLFGEKYFVMCIAHSRVYAKKLSLPLSKLGYADKASILVYPNWFFKRWIYWGGEAQEYHNSGQRQWGFPVKVELIKADYSLWVENNCCEMKTQ